MIFHDSDLVKHLPTIVDPFDPAMVQPASLDVRLSNIFRVLDNSSFPQVIDPATDNGYTFERVPVAWDDCFLLNPNTFALGSTVERFTIPADIAARFEGKSSLGRLGLLTHITAGFIDPGFEGHITVELSNVTNRPIKLHPGMRIGQVCLHRMTGRAVTPYGTVGFGSHYQGQSEPQVSRGHENFDTYRPGRVRS